MTSSGPNTSPLSRRPAAGALSATTSEIATAASPPAATQKDLLRIRLPESPASRAGAYYSEVGRRARTIAGVLILSLAALASGPGTANASPLRGNGMWIWYVSQSSGGKLSRIARKAHTHHIDTLYVKSSDGTSAWAQFSRNLVQYFHSRGLRVCAWQFVYGSDPGGEARRGAAAVHKGADCLVIDAESSYEGRYAAADRYVDRLHRLIPHTFPLSLASFPYVDYHPSFPYSVFMGVRAAQYDQPQLYWRTIGTSVAEGFRHTWRYNRIYGRRIFPLGQTYQSPPRRQIRRFRRFANAYHFGGVSWWDWQETSKREWRTLGHPMRRGIHGFDRPNGAFPELSRGARGDIVVSAQERLRRAHLHLPVSGVFRASTRRAVERFQRRHGLAITGAVNRPTWRGLLRYEPVSIDWSRRAARSTKRGTASAPRSATLPTVRREIPSPSSR